MNIGIIGSGVVGQQLGAGLQRHGYKVMLGTRDPKKLEEWKASSHAQVGTDAEAAKFGDLIILATKWEGTEHAIKLAGAENFTNKVVLDVTNPLHFIAEGQAPTLAVGHNTSGAEIIQHWIPGAKVVKVWNTITAYAMVDPKHDPTMFIAGNEEGKKVAAEILHKVGWKDVIDIGGIEGARMLEPLAQLWITHGFRNNKWDHAFKLIR